eukprot:2627816-Prymnesium_polylepis.2
MQRLLPRPSPVQQQLQPYQLSAALRQLRRHFGYNTQQRDRVARAQQPTGTAARQGAGPLKAYGYAVYFRVSSFRHPRSGVVTQDAPKDAIYFPNT